MYPKTRQQIAEEYNISRRTLARWLKKEQIELSSGLVLIEEQQLVYSAFGVPPTVAKTQMSHFGT